MNTINKKNDGEAIRIDVEYDEFVRGKYFLTKSEAGVPQKIRYKVLRTWEKGEYQLVEFRPYFKNRRIADEIIAFKNGQNNVACIRVVG